MKRQNNYRERLFEESAHSCIYCGHPLTLDTMEIDHIVPRSKGGGEDISNKVCACPRCNALKADKGIPEFLETMSPKKLHAYENRLENLFEQGKLSAYKWDLLNPLPPLPDEETDKVAECPLWQIFCYLCGEFV
jgi:CRISPR/Cas system Type II protein with McrA/HNH and RuvC-like nuclease domain